MKKQRNTLPHQGELVRKIPKETCFKCKHYGCGDFIETICPGYEEAGRITQFIRSLFCSRC